MVINLIALSLFLFSLIVRFKSLSLSGYSLYLALGLSFAGTLLIFIGGWLGGELVFTYGIGVKKE